MLCFHYHWSHDTVSLNWQTFNFWTFTVILYKIHFSHTYNWMQFTNILTGQNVFISQGLTLLSNFILICSLTHLLLKSALFNIYRYTNVLFPFILDYYFPSIYITKYLLLFQCFVNFFKLVLWSNMWSFLENVFWAIEKNSVDLDQYASYVSVRSIWSVILIRNFS